MRATGVILAAGRGERCGVGENKVLARLGGSPLLCHCLSAFVRSGVVGELVVVARPGEEGKVKALATAPIPVQVVPGGDRRQDSARAGAQAAKGEFVLIHDGARPLVSPALIQRVLAAAEEHGAAVPTLPECDTLRYLDDGFLRPEPLVRERLVRIQTPQGFRRDVLLAAFREAERRGLELPDDAAAVFAWGGRVAAVQGEPWNLKITHPEDLTLAERLLWEEGPAGLRSPPA